MLESVFLNLQEQNFSFELKLISFEFVIFLIQSHAWKFGNCLKYTWMPYFVPSRTKDTHFKSFKEKERLRFSSFLTIWLSFCNLPMLESFLLNLQFLKEQNFSFELKLISFEFVIFLIQSHAWKFGNCFKSIWMPCFFPSWTTDTYFKSFKEKEKRIFLLSRWLIMKAEKYLWHRFTPCYIRVRILYFGEKFPRKLFF